MFHTKIKAILSRNIAFIKQFEVMSSAAQIARVENIPGRPFKFWVGAL